MTYTKKGRMAAGALAFVAWLGLARYLAADVATLGSWPAALWQNAGYLTDLSNLLLAVTMTGVALGRPMLSRPAIVGWAITAITTVGVAFWLVGGKLVWGSSALEDVLLHGVTPWAALLFWLAFAPKGHLGGWHVAAWMAWPLAYFAYALTRGAVSGKFPYAWMDPAGQGVAAVSQTLGMLLTVYALLAVMLWVLDKVLGRRHRQLAQGRA